MFERRVGTPVDLHLGSLHMRLIHTSDWHFGKRFLENDMLPLQAEFCDWFVDLVKQESVDCVLVSGDVYDRAIPKNDAIDLLDDVLHRISGAGASIVLISGNHDSAERLQFGTRFMTGGGLHIRTERKDVGSIGAPVTITGRNGDQVEILPLPYLDPERVQIQEGTVRNHESVLRAVVDYQIQQLKDPSRTIAMSHAFVVGGSTSESERNLIIGGTGSVPTSLFDSFGYVALGHLHRPQELGDGRLVYSGTPMPYSFSEEHEKSIRIIDVDDRGITSEKVRSGTYRPVVTITGTIDELTTSSKFDSHTSAFVRAKVTDSTFQVGAMERLRKRFPNILEMEHTSISAQGLLDAERLKELAKRSEEDVVREYVKETWPDGLDDFETRFLDEALANVLKEADQ